MVLAIVIFASMGGGIPKQEGLPDAVAAKREAIYKAARSRNYDTLAVQAATPFKYSFGETTEDGFAGFLATADEHLALDTEVAKGKYKNNFEIIQALLKLPYALQGDIYVWPAVFTKGAADWTEEDIAQMKKLLPDELIEGYRQFGAYAYYRLGITEEGKWVYYIAGD